jgi:tRNA(Leu) C34 or U34 (ribose-2'-O)-methylase TrmL
MNWQEAIQKSTKETATRIEKKGTKRYTTIRYKDGSGFVLFGENHKVDFSNSREATSKDLNGFTDWLPSE